MSFASGYSRLKSPAEPNDEQVDGIEYCTICPTEEQVMDSVCPDDPSDRSQEVIVISRGTYDVFIRT